MRPIALPNPLANPLGNPLAGGRTSRKPSSYPALPFHLLRLGQVVSSIIVGSVLAFFTHHLHREDYPIPWTFILLLTVSCSTVAALIYTSTLHFTRTLAPRINLLANGALTILWVVGLSLLVWNLGWVLGHRCVNDNWHNGAGVMVCRLYKALTAFSVTGLASSALALGLDVRTQRQVTKLGKYNPMLDIKAPNGLVRSSSPFHAGGDEWESRSRNGSVVGNSLRAPSHDLARPYKVQKPIEAQQFGYAAPSEQTSYGGSGEHWL